MAWPGKMDINENVQPYVVYATVTKNSAIYFAKFGE